MQLTKFILLTTISSLIFTISAQNTPIDGIAAVVGDSIILESEVNGFVDMKIAATGGSSDALVRGMIYREALEELIDNRVLVVHAMQDTNISFSEAEVRSQAESRVKMIMDQNGLSKAALEEALQKEQGITIDEFREQMSVQIKQDFIRQQVQQFYFSANELSRDEVKAFFTEYNDSLPPAGESVKLQKLEIALKADTVVEQSAYDTILYIRDEILNGSTSFEDMAKEFSSGPNASNGGDLGFVSKGTLTLIQLEERIFMLEPGDLSDPISTKLGFHLAKVIERRDNKVHALHIFLPVNPNPKKVEETTALLDSIAKAKPSQDELSTLIQEHSSDAVSKAYDGEMEWQLVSTLTPSISKGFSNDYPVDSYSSPVVQENIYSIYRVINYDKSRKLNFKDDYNQIKKFAVQIQSQELLKDLVKKWHKDLYIKVY
jgi:peptidyl-prolyl cis-trans isomerase SurA